MRFFDTASRTAFAAAMIVSLASPVGLGVAHAQDKTNAAAASADAADPKQVTLTQKSLDNLIAAQKEIRDIEAKVPKDAKVPDAKIEAQFTAAMTKNGFASADDFANASYSVGVVLAGMDPDTGKYVGAEAVTKKQIEEIKADKKMPPKEQKEALDELNESAKSPVDKPPQANIDLVTANMSKLSEILKQPD